MIDVTEKWILLTCEEVGFEEVRGLTGSKKKHLVVVGTDAREGRIPQSSTRAGGGG